MYITIITINFNDAIGLAKTLESIFAQSYKQIESIVIDGGSSDGSVGVIKEYADQINYWISEPDNGIYNAMNKGVVVAHGDYCNFMNSGDIFASPEVLEQVVSANKEADVISGDLQYGDESLCISPERVTMKDLYKRSLYHQATFIRTKLLREHPYDETMRSAADWKFFLQTLIFDNASYAHIHYTVAKFEPGGFSSSSKETGHNELMQELKKTFPPRVLEDYEDYVNGLSSYRTMMNRVGEIPPVRKLIYHINIFVLKLLNLRLKSKWIAELPSKDK